MMGLDSLACIDPSQKKEGTICFFKHCLGFFWAKFDAKAKILWSQIQSGLFV